MGVQQRVDSGLSRAFLTGDDAVAHAVRQSNVDLVAAYPITPQTVIVERIAEFAANGEVQGRVRSGGIRAQRDERLHRRRPDRGQGLHRHG
jgi:pyruvate ferredoxin oxidoreductase, alpha subunit (EC 1.2.7.1)